MSELCRPLDSVTHSLPSASAVPSPLGDVASTAGPRKKLRRELWSLSILLVRPLRASPSSCVVVGRTPFVCGDEDWSFFRPPKRLRRAPRPCRIDTGCTADASSDRTPRPFDMTAAVKLCGGEPVSQRAERRQVGDGAAGVSRSGWGGANMEISGANVLSKSSRMVRQSLSKRTEIKKR